MAYASIRPVLWAIALMMAVMVVLTPVPATAQNTTFGVANQLCSWTNAPAQPDPTTCTGPNLLSQVIPGQPVYYLTTITGNSSSWSLTLDELYPPPTLAYPQGFVAQHMSCVDKASPHPTVFSGPNPQATSPQTPSFGPIPINAGQDLYCMVAGYYKTSTTIGTDASNEVKITAAGAGGATGSGSHKVTATVLTTATLPTDLSITKSPNVNSIALGGTVTWTVTISNSATGKAVYLGGFLQVYDRLALLPGSMGLTATLMGIPGCTASAGASCLDPPVVTSPLNPWTSWSQFAVWRYVGTNPGFLPPGGSMTLVYTIKIDSAATCASTTAEHGFRNLASFDLLGQVGATVAEIDSSNNATNPSDDPSSKVVVTHTLPDCPPGSGNPDVTVSKVARNPNNFNKWPWGSSVTYDVTITNNSAFALTNLTLNDSVFASHGDTTIMATATPNPCVPACVSSILTGPQLFGYQGATLWYTNTATTLAANSSLTFPITIKYDMNSCEAQAHDDRFIRNRIWVNFATPSGSFARNANEDIKMEKPPLCDFKVTKTFQGGSPPATLHFNTPYQYDVTYTNQSSVPATIYTLADLLRVDVPGYAVTMPLSYSYSCTGPAGLTGFTAQSPGFPALANGTVQYTTTPVNGSALIWMVGSPIAFPAGASLTCTVNVVVQRPAPGDPNCMGTGAAGLQNTAMLFPSSGYNFSGGVPSDPDFWSTQRAPLPRCFNLTVNKSVTPPSALGTGPPLAYTITVTNNGDPIIGLAPPNWLTLTDVFAGTYSPGAATATPACAMTAGAACEFISNSGNPISLGIKNLASGQVLTLGFPLAPPFTTENVRNDVAIQAQGTLATNWYPREPNTLVNFKEVPITNPASEGTAMLKVCKVAGEGVDVGTPYEFTATAGGTGHPVSVPAGPPPGGYCQIVGTYAPGTPVVLAETVPAHHEVAGIEVAGAAAALGPVVDTAGGKVDLKLDEGVSEATFTNIGLGYVEICKAGEVRGLHRFTLDDRPLEVPGGACTAAIELRAGMHRLVELEAAETVMVGCGIWPASRRIDCPPGGRTVIFEVRAGGIQMQSVVTVTNGPARPAYSRGRPAGAAARR